MISSSLRPIAAIAVICLFTPEVAATNKRQARRHFRQAETHFQLGRFQEALASYAEAYQAAPLPAFLFNIGQCHFELRQYADAISFYQRFVATAPPASQESLALEQLEQAQEALEKLERQREQQATDARERHAEERKRSAILVAEVSRRKTLQLQLNHLRAEAERPLLARSWLWGAVAATVAVVGGGVAWALTADHGTRTVLPSGDLGTIDGR